LIAKILSTSGKNFAPPIWLAHAAFALSLVPMHFNMRDEFALVAFALVVLLAAASEQNGVKSKLQGARFVHLGDASYSLYMWHMPIKVGIFAIMGKVFGTSLLPMWGAAVLSYAVALIAALVCYKYFEIPIKNYIIAHYPFKPKPKQQPA
jgi:peptidoglycan/LPS O-acetylase OafA/YrhL